MYDLAPLHLSSNVMRWPYLHHPYIFESTTTRSSLLLLALLEHLLDDLLLLDQESTNNAVLDAVGAS
jgi:hypothetical protein